MKSDSFVLLAISAEKFGCRPSELAGFRDPVLALDFDLAAAARLLERDRSALGEAVPPPDVVPPARHRDIYW